jgi:hypothetical protein
MFHEYPKLCTFFTGYFTSDNESGEIENATHNTSGGKAGYLSPPCSGLRSSVLWVAFSIHIIIIIHYRS